MTTVFDVPAAKLIKAAAAELKQNDSIKAPAWAKYAKTGPHTERSPLDIDFWFVRCASILRQAYVRGPIGVSSLRVHYGGRQNNGVSREHHRDASGGMIRKAVQQLESVGLLEKATKGKKGRVLSAKGRAFLDKVAKNG